MQTFSFNFYAPARGEPFMPGMMVYNCLQAERGPDGVWHVPLDLPEKEADADER